MRAFAQLHTALEEASGRSDQRTALSGYFAAAPPEDAAWALHLLGGWRSKRLIRSAELRKWSEEASGLPSWLIAESHQAVGDVAEAAALLLPGGRDGSDEPLHSWMERRLLPAQYLPATTLKRIVFDAWSELDHAQRIVLNRWMTGTFRPPVDRRTLLEALSEATGIDRITLAYRLSRGWNPSGDSFERLTAADTSDADRCRPYPFCRPELMAVAASELGRCRDWQISWMWSGIRAQLVRRRGRTHIWSASEALITAQFPEVHDSARLLPDGLVLEGEIVAWSDGAVAPVGALRRRLGRDSITKKLLREAPVCFLASDVLEDGGEDVRMFALSRRRALLERALARCTRAFRVQSTPLIDASSWEDVVEIHRTCRDRGAGGLTLRHLNAPYGDNGATYVWKVDPDCVAAVLLYVERDRGGPPKYTFGVWDGEELVPIAKVAADRGAGERDEIDHLVREHTTERFGPVRAVAPKLVFRLGFDGIRPSSRRKSGLVLHHPRILDRRRDIEAEDAGSLQTLRSLLRTRTSVKV